MLVGDFNFDELNNASPYIAPVFFISYMMLVYITLINVFIAILNEYYNVAQEEKRGYSRTNRYTVLPFCTLVVPLSDCIPFSAMNRPLTATGSGGGAQTRPKDTLFFDNVEYDIANR